MTTPDTTAPLLGEPLPVELMNTVWADRDGVHEALGTPDEVASWLHAISTRPDAADSGLAGWLDTSSPTDVAPLAADLRRLRDAVRRLAARETHDVRAAALGSLHPQQAVAVINDLAAGPTTWPVLSWPVEGRPGVTMTTDTGPGVVFVADLARAAARLFGGTTREDLRTCQAPGCVLYFVKQHPRREWCSAGCGNRARVARHYLRHHP